MNVDYNLADSARNPDIQELALGFFDGLHLGHHQVITGSRPLSELRNTAVLSFQKHPQSVLFPDQPINLITGLPHKQKILADWGITNIVLLPFDIAIAQKTPEQFLSELREGFPRLKVIRVGENFRFGRGRCGTTKLLQDWGKAQHLIVEVIPSIMREGLPISSSRIRQLLQARDLGSAPMLLGRPYSIYGSVVQGAGLGNKLGFPTANISTEDSLLLPHGVYGGHAVTPDGGQHPAAINIGMRPTVSTSHHPTIEAHLLNYSGDLYGHNLDLEISYFLRGEIKFKSSEYLIRQVAEDIQKVRSHSKENSL